MLLPSHMNYMHRPFHPPQLVMQSVCSEGYKSLRPAIYIPSCIKLHFILNETLPNKGRQSVA